MTYPRARGPAWRPAGWIYAHAGFITSSTLALISLVIPWSYQVSPTHAGFTGTPVFLVLGLRLDAVVVPAALLLLLGSISLGAARAGVWLLVGAWTAAAIVLVLSFMPNAGSISRQFPGPGFLALSAALVVGLATIRGNRAT